MSEKAGSLKDAFERMNNSIIAFVEGCSPEDWKKATAEENWPVGIVARHIADGHYSLLGLMQLIVAGADLPEMSMDAIDAMNEKHAADHADCTTDEVLSLLRDNGGKICDYLAGLSDDDLNRSAYLSLAGGDINTAQVVEHILISGCSEHLENMKAAVRK